MLTIRMAEERDIDALIRMRFDFSREDDASIAEHDYEEFAERCGLFLRRAIQMTSNWRIWVADVDHQIVSHMYVQVVEKVPRPRPDSSSPYGYLTNVYTIPSHRGQGIGQQVQSEILRWATTEKLDFLIVWPSENSVKFYTKSGFSPCGEAMEWFPRVCDGT